MSKTEEITDGSDWDLSVLFTGSNDPTIDEMITKMENLRKEVCEYKGKIISFTESDVEPFLRKFEKVFKMGTQLYMFPHLNLAVDQSSKEYKELDFKIKKVIDETRKELSFIDLELGKLLEVNPALVNSSPKYKHYLEKIVIKRPHMLTEDEENLIIDKNTFGINEWEKLKNQWLATRKFSLLIDGKEEEHSYSTGRKYWMDSNRENRKESITKILGGFEKDIELYSTCLRAIAGNVHLEAKRRNYSVLEKSCQDNDIEKSMLDKMFSAIDKNVDIYQDFLILKAKLFGTDVLLGEDYYSPVQLKDESKISWKQAQQIVLDSYGECDDEFRSVVKGLFDSNRIDSRPKATKRGGAFCAPDIKNKSSFILQSFYNSIDGVSTLAHELGHAIHNHFITKKQPYLVQHPGMSMAEVASEFGRMLFIDNYREKIDNQEVKKKLLFQALDDLVMVVFWPSVLFKFEQSLYDAINNGEYLSPTKINELLSKAQDFYFGKSVKWLPEQINKWVYIPHLFFQDFRFYNFPYIFAELIVLGIYNKYKSEGKSFIPKYKEFLSAGSSKSPKEVTAELGIDLNSEEFWNTGLDEIRRLLNEAKTLFK